jgi:multicomponent Na+:H+ antiporter subunit D
MPVTCICGIIGALSISAFPLTSGFISKSMISDAAGAEHMAWVWFLLIAASAGTPLYIGFRFPWFVFFARDSGLRPGDPPWSMKAAMVLCALMCIGLGVAPGLLYALLPAPVDFVPYAAGHVVFQLQLLLFAGLAFFLMLGFLTPRRTVTLDVDWLYRGLGVTLTRWADAWAGKAWNALVAAVSRGTRAAGDVLARQSGEDGIWSRTWSTGAMAFWMAAVLAGYLILTHL